MDSGFYAACTALVSRTQALDTIANNLANASTVGFRSERNVFRSVMASASAASGSPLDRAVNSYGVLGGTTLDQSQGALEKTGNDLDMAIEGKGYFVVKTASGEMYTRNGAFQVSSSGQMTTSNGDPVIGDRGAITIQPGRVSISADGTISSNGAVAGKLRVVEFPAGTELSSLGNTYYSAPANTAETSAHSSVRQGMLESSNVNPVNSMVELINAQRTAEMMQRALGMMGTEMDKTASQELSKVS